MSIQINNNHEHRRCTCKADMYTLFYKWNYKALFDFGGGVDFIHSVRLFWLCFCFVLSNWIMLKEEEAVWVKLWLKWSFFCTWRHLYNVSHFSHQTTSQFRQWIHCLVSYKILNPFVFELFQGLEFCSRTYYCNEAFLFRI